MNELYQTFLGQSATIDFASWLAQNGVNLLLQSTALILLGLIAARCLKPQGSAVQSAIYRATLIAVLACPIVAVGLNLAGLSGWTIELPKTTRMVSVEVEMPEVDTSAISSARFESIVTETNPQEVVVDPQSLAANFPSLLLKDEAAIANTETKSAVEPVAPVFTEMEVTNQTFAGIYLLAGAIWLIGSLFFLTRLVFAYSRLKQIRNESSIAPTSEVAICSQLAIQIKVPTPDIRRNSLLSSPCLTGIAEPTILLPAEIEDRISLEKAFAHELAHLRRNDTTWNLIQRISLALFFFQPLLWRLVYRLETTAEEVCDDFVVRHCLDRTGYAQQLVELAESNLLAPNMAGLGMFSSRTMLGHRVGRILDTTRKLTTNVSLPVVAAIGLMALVASMLGGLIGIGPSASPGTAEVSTVESSTEIEQQEPVTDLTATPVATVSGTILDPSGKPLAESDIYIMQSDWKKDFGWIQNILARGKSDSSGKYEISFPSQSKKHQPDHNLNQHNNIVVAFHSDFGPHWKEFDVEKSQSQHDIKLVKPGVFSYQLIDIDGQPVPDALVEIHSLSTSGTSKDVFFNNPEHNGTLKSDKNGMIRIKHFGSGRSICAWISAPGLAMKYVILSLISAEDYTQYYGKRNPEDKIFISGDKLVLPPGMEIKGKVTDAKTGQPIPNTRINFHRVFNRQVSCVSDDFGNYHVTNVPVTNQLFVQAHPAEDQPYLKHGYHHPIPNGTKHEHDIELHRGIWITGKVTDKDTGKPVKNAIVYHFPTKKNLNLDQYPEYSGFGGMLSFNKHYLTDHEGQFKMVGIRGPALFGVLAGNYALAGNTLDKYKGKLAQLGATETGKMLNAGFEVNFEDEQNQTEIQVEKGKDIQISILDPERKPLSGVEVFASNRQNNYSSVVAKEPNFLAKRFSNGETRLIKFLHRERRLGVIKEVRADQANGANPVSVQLQPYATVKCRLLDANGDPVSGRVTFNMKDGSQLNPKPTLLQANPQGGMMIQNEGNDGNFVYKNILSGVEYQVTVFANGGNGPITLRKKFSVKPGETVDLGAIDISNVKTDWQAFFRMPKEDTVSVTGVVIDSNDKPVEGAEVSFGNKFKTTSGNQGIFLLQIPYSKANSRSNLDLILSTEKVGYGKTLTTITNEQRDKARIKLVNDTYPIKGKLIDTEGNPVPGAKIEVERMLILDGFDIDQMIEKASNASKPDHLPSGGMFTSLETDPVESAKDGSFTIKGIGAGRIAYLKITGEKIAIQKAVVATSKAAKTKNLFARFGSINGDEVPVYGNSPNLICEPSQPIHGTVIDRETKRPLANIVVQSYSFASSQPGSRYSGQTDLKTVTDENGKFQLNGMPTGTGHQIILSSDRKGNEAIPYVTQYFDVPTSQGTAPNSMSIELQPAIWIRGKVTNQDTGEPIGEVAVYYQTTNDNEAGQQLDQSQKFAVLPRAETNENGDFKLVGLPGPGLISTLVHMEVDYPMSQGWSKISKEDRVGIRYPMSPTVNTSIQVVDIPAEGNSVVSVKLTKGKKVRIKTVDENENPVSGVAVSYLPDYLRHTFNAETAEFEAPSFIPGEKRTLIFRHSKKKLGAVKTIDSDQADKTEPITVKLLPMGTIVAQLVDQNGNPTNAANMNFTLVNKSGQNLWRMRKLEKTKEDGTIAQPLIPGTYTVSFSSSKGFSGYKKVELKPGQKFDLGPIDTTKKFEVFTLSEPSMLTKAIKDLPNAKPANPSKEDVKIKNED